MTKRFITSNADSRIPAETQIFLWTLFDNTPKPGDYFQVFELSVQNGIQIIRHFQEEPEREETVVVYTDTVVSENVYVIQNDDVIRCCLRRIIEGVFLC